MLSLSCNNLTEIPDLHGTATCCIQELCLANNKIHVIDNLQYYPELRILDLRHNAITVLENIGNKEHLVRYVLEWKQMMIWNNICYFMYGNEDCHCLVIRSWT